MLDLVEHYTDRGPGTVLALYLPALREVDGSDSHEGLDPGFPGDWRRAAGDPEFRRAQGPRARPRLLPVRPYGGRRRTGCGRSGSSRTTTLIVMHGDGGDSASFGSIRARALGRARPPARGGGEVAYLHAFLDARV